MSATLLIQNIGAGLSLIVGLNGLLRPVHMGKAVGLEHNNLVGLVEIRVLFGSFLVALPIYALWRQQSELFIFFGVAALAAFVIKTSFTIIDKCPWPLIRVGILVDAVLALCLLSPLYLPF